MKIKSKIMHKHHSIPVGKSIETIDWHLQNLWNEGFKTIVMLTPKEHIKHHKKHGFHKFSSVTKKAG